MLKFCHWQTFKPFTTSKNTILIFFIISPKLFYMRTQHALYSLFIFENIVNNYFEKFLFYCKKYNHLHYNIKKICNILGVCFNFSRIFKIKKIQKIIPYLLIKFLLDEFYSFIYIFAFIMIF